MRRVVAGRSAAAGLPAVRRGVRCNSNTIITIISSSIIITITIITITITITISNHNQ